MKQAQASIPLALVLRHLGAEPPSAVRELQEQIALNPEERGIALKLLPVLGRELDEHQQAVLAVDVKTREQIGETTLLENVMASLLTHEDLKGKADAVMMGVLESLQIGAKGWQQDAAERILDCALKVKTGGRELNKAANPDIKEFNETDPDVGMLLNLIRAGEMHSGDAVGLMICNWVDANARDSMEMCIRDVSFLEMLVAVQKGLNYWVISKAGEETHHEAPHFISCKDDPGFHELDSSMSLGIRVPESPPCKTR